MPWLRYIVQRLMLTVGVLLAVIFIVYALGRSADVDPVYRYLDAGGELRGEAGEIDARTYRRGAHTLGLDLPTFFFTLHPNGYPDTLYRLLPLGRRRQAQALLRQGLPWKDVEALQVAVWDKSAQQSVFGAQQQRLLKRARTQGEIMSLAPAAGVALTNSRPPLLPMPKFVWYGWRNGFTHFVGGLLHGNMGYSLQYGDSVAVRIRRAFAVTLPLALSALVLALLLGIPFGIRLARGGYSWSRLGAYALLSAPGFWLAVLTLAWLTGPGRPFPGPGWVTEDAPLNVWLAHALLPIGILALPAAAYIGLMFEEGLRSVPTRDLRDFVRLRGASEWQLWYGELMTLGISPTVATVLAQLLPSFIGGSVVLEHVFNIPGAGRLVYESILARDWPVVLGVVLVGALATMLGYVVMDLINAALDPQYRKRYFYAR